MQLPEQVIVQRLALGDLFGERNRWASTLNPMQFAQVSLVVPGFTGRIEVDLPVPCTYDMDIATTKYFAALADGEVPMLLLFSGTAFCGPGGFSVRPVPWDKEASCRMPVAVWREAIEQHFPGCGWLRLPGEPAMTRFVAAQLSTSHWYDISAARRDLGYEPAVSVEEGLKRLAETLAARP